MISCVISMDARTAFVDLRKGGLDFPDAERLLEALQPYVEGAHVRRILVDIRGHDPVPAPVEILLMGLHDQAQRHRLGVEVRSGPMRTLVAAS